MKKKGLASIVLALGLFVLLGSGFLVNANNNSPPANVVINNTGYAKDRKTPVRFSHERHVKEHNIACTQCHHVYKDGKNVWKQGEPVKKCIECHNPVKKEGRKMRLMRAYHKNCMGCHRKLAKEGKISRSKYKKLRKCSTCHVRKSS